MTCKRRPAILKKQLSLVFYTKDDFLYFSCLILYNKLIDLCRFINLSTLCAGHDTCRRRNEQDSVEVENSVIKSFSSLWSTKMTSTTENHVWKKNKKPVHRRKAVSFDWGLSYETILFFLFVCFSHIQSVQARDKIPYLSVRLWSLKQC